MRTLVYGAGPLGSYVAAKLHEAGADVALLARRQRLADLRAHGVVLEFVPDGRRETHHVPVVEELAPNDDYALVLVVLRKDQTAAVLPTLAANRRVRTVLFLQNNAAGFGEYTRWLGAQRVMAGHPTLGGQRDGAVMRILRFGPLPIPIGEPDGSVTPRTRAVAAHLARMRGHRVQLRTDIDAWLASHIPALLPYLGLYAVGLDTRQFAATRDARLLGARAQREALRAQAAAGVPVTPPWIWAAALQPEPLGLALLRALATTTLFEVGIAAHARSGRGEVGELLRDYRDRVAPAGLPTPLLDRAIAHVDASVPDLPAGSREIPVRWTGLAALAAAGSVITAGAAWRRRG